MLCLGSCHQAVCLSVGWVCSQVLAPVPLLSLEVFPPLAQQGRGAKLVLEIQGCAGIGEGWWGEGCAGNQGVLGRY